MEYGDIVAELYGTYATGILRMCYLYLNDYQLAEDAMQETFVRVFRYYEKFAQRSSAKTWITRIAINVCKDIMAKKRDEQMWQMDDFEEERGCEEHQYLSVENNMVISRAIGSLEEKLRAVVILFYYQEMNTAQIAKILNIPRTTVEFRLRQARKMLYKEMKGVEFHDRLEA